MSIAVLILFRVELLEKSSLAPAHRYVLREPSVSSYAFFETGADALYTGRRRLQQRGPFICVDKYQACASAVIVSGQNLVYIPMVCQGDVAAGPTVLAFAGIAGRP